MAWLQNLTGQAEKFLNKIDQKAANVLNDPNFNTNPISQKLLGDSDICVTTPLTYDVNEDESHIPIEDFNSQFYLAPDTSCEAHVEEAIEKPFDEKVKESPEGSPVKIFNKDQLTDLGTDVFCDDTNKALSISSKSESVLHSFSSAEDIQKYLERISKLEFENGDLSKQLLNIQHLYSEIRNENVSLKCSLERAMEMASVAEREMEQYKVRAHRILQEKEKLISLRMEDEVQQNSEENIYVSYNKELKNELKFQQGKNQDLQNKISDLNSELTSLQQQYVVMQNTLQQSKQNRESDLFSERRKLMTIEEEIKLKSQELNQVHQELIQKNYELVSKTQEIDQLKSQLRQRSQIVSNEEVEHRIQNLTQTLMIKQNKLETITSERNALRIQLEKLENEYHRNLSLARSSQQKIVVHVNDTDDVKLQIPQLMRVSPLDVGVSRRVKRAYSSLDALSIRTGVFLRRYPTIRVFVFCYMVLLHLWVLVILLNYAPSMK